MRSAYRLLIPILCGLGLSSSWANDAETMALISLLTTPQPEYKISDQVDFDARLYPKNYQIGWINSPEVDVSLRDYQGYQHPILVKMTVIAAQGKIVNIQILKSTGSKAADQKIIQALQSAKLEPIRYADANLTYVLEHEFEIQKPLR